MEMSRNQENFIILTVVYDELNDFSYGDKKDFRDARDLISELSDCSYDEVSDYIKASVALTLQNYGTIRSAFLPFLKNWKWERLPLLTQAILLTAYAHFYFVEKVDKKIVINTAVDFAKKYVDEKQGKFINAILDGVLK